MPLSSFLSMSATKDYLLLFDAQFMFGKDSKHIAIDFEDNDNEVVILLNIDNKRQHQIGIKFFFLCVTEKTINRFLSFVSRNWKIQNLLLAV